MSLRLRRLERVEQEQLLVRTAERLAAQFERDADDVLRQLREVTERVQRWGLAAELRRFAQESGLSDEEVRSRYDEALGEIEAERAITIEG